MAGSQDDTSDPQLLADEADLLGFDEPVPLATPALPIVPAPPAAPTYPLTATALRDQLAAFGQRLRDDLFARHAEQAGFNDRLLELQRLMQIFTTHVEQQRQPVDLHCRLPRHRVQLSRPAFPVRDHSRSQWHSRTACRSRRCAYSEIPRWDGTPSTLQGYR